MTLIEELALKYAEQGADYAEAKYCICKELGRALTEEELKTVFRITKEGI